MNPLARKLTASEAAAYLQIAASTLAKMRLTGKGPVYMKLGARRVVYDVADLERWASACRRESTSHKAPSSTSKGGAK